MFGSLAWQCLRIWGVFLELGLIPKASEKGKNTASLGLEKKKLACNECVVCTMSLFVSPQHLKVSIIVYTEITFIPFSV